MPNCTRGRRWTVVRFAVNPDESIPDLGFGRPAFVHRPKLGPVWNPTSSTIEKTRGIDGWQRCDDVWRHIFVLDLKRLDGTRYIGCSCDQVVGCSVQAQERQIFHFRAEALELLQCVFV